MSTLHFLLATLIILLVALVFTLVMPKDTRIRKLFLGLAGRMFSFLLGMAVLYPMSDAMYMRWYVVALSAITILVVSFLLTILPKRKNPSKLRRVLTSMLYYFILGAMGFYALWFSHLGRTAHSSIFLFIAVIYDVDTILNLLQRLFQRQRQKPS